MQSGGPVFNFQVGDSFEFTGIVGNEDRIEILGMRGDKQVIGPDDASLLLQQSPYLAVCICCLDLPVPNISDRTEFSQCLFIAFAL